MSVVVLTLVPVGKLRIPNRDMVGPRSWDKAVVALAASHFPYISHRAADAQAVSDKPV